MSVATSVLCAINWCHAANSDAQQNCAFASKLLYLVSVPLISRFCALSFMTFNVLCQYHDGAVCCDRSGFRA